MGLAQDHILGRDQQFFVATESTPGTFVKPAGASASDSSNRHPNVITSSFNPNTKRKDRTDAYMATRDVLERITDKEEISWSVDMFYIPSGTKNVAPDCGGLLQAAGFTETVNANDVSYAMHSNQALTACSMTRHWSGIYQEALAGCVVDSMKMMFAGGEEPKISFSGRAMSFAHTGTSTLNGAMSASTTMVVQTADKNAFMTNANAAGTASEGARSVIKIDDGSSPQTDAEVDVDTSAPSFTISAAGTHDNAAVVTPYVPTHADKGSPIAGTSGTFTWDSFAAKVTALEFEIKNNVTYNDDEAFAGGMTDAIPNLREITGSMTFRIRKDHVIHIQNRKELVVRALSLTVGGAAQSGTRLVVSMPYCELEFNEVSVPETEEATINATFRALGSSGNDALTLTHT